MNNITALETPNGLFITKSVTMNSDNRLNVLVGYSTDIVREYPEVKAINFQISGSVMSNGRAVSKIRNYLKDSKKFTKAVYLNGTKI